MAASTWRGRIAFGMVSIPVRLYKAARRERIRFHHVYRPDAVEAPEDEPEEERAAPQPPARGPRLVAPADPTPVETERETAPVARVHNTPMAEREEVGEPPAPLPKEQILKAFELEKDRYVVFRPEEIAALRARTSTELAITEFVRLPEIDPVYFDVSYYVEPEPAGEKPYAILYAALVDSGYAGMGSVAMHGREHVAVIRPGRRGLILHTIFYAKEVRAEAEYPADLSQVGAKERQLATMFVQALAAPFAPEKLKDTQEERLRAMIESRAATSVPAAGREPAAAAAAPPVDILEALKKSLAAARKPMASETRTPPAPAQTARRPRKK